MTLGKSYVLLSGVQLTASWQYSAKYTTRNFAKVGITVETLPRGSGTQYTVRGYPVEGNPVVLSIASGTVIASGSMTYLTLSNPYDQIDVGVKEPTSNSSGTATVYVTGKRK